MVDSPPARGRPSSPDALGDDVMVLRPLTLADVGAWHAGEDEEIRRWFQFPRPSSRADVTAAIKAWTRSWSEGGPVRHFGIWSRDDDRLLGGVELRRRDGDDAYVSYLVFASERRRGHATRAVRLLSGYARRELSIERLVIITDDANVASRSVAERAGFRLDGEAEAWEHVEVGSMLRYVKTWSSSPI